MITLEAMLHAVDMSSIEAFVPHWSKELLLNEHMQGIFYITILQYYYFNSPYHLALYQSQSEIKKKLL